MSAAGIGDEAVRLVALDDREEAARADVYGLLARLWSAPPDDALLQQFALPRADAPAPGSFLAVPWQALADALRATTPRAAADEYDTLFLGVGKPEVFLYGSFYLSGFLHETPLAALRAELASLGLGRDPVAGETEDHIAFLCEVMRYLIAGDDIAHCNLERQRRFWRAHLQPWIERLCESVQGHEAAVIYSALAGFTRAFAQVETQALDMIE
jgi:TorA maturation chaperone TorD